MQINEPVCRPKSRDKGWCRPKSRDKRVVKRVIVLVNEERRKCRVVRSCGPARLRTRGGTDVVVEAQHEEAWLVGEEARRREAWLVGE